MSTTFHLNSLLSSPQVEDCCAPTLSPTSSYILNPPLSVLQTLSPLALANLKSFSITAPGHGSIVWEGCVDLRNVNISRTVRIEQNKVSVYEVEEKEGGKPEEGEGLNRPAIITLEGVWPKGWVEVRGGGRCGCGHGKVQAEDREDHWEDGGGVQRL